MKLPSKIHPDYLKDTIVVAHFSSDKPTSVLGGLIFNELSNNFSVPKSNSSNAFIEFGLSNQLAITQGSNLHLKNEVFTIKLINNSLVFNTINTYNGWSDYSKTIFDVIGKLLSKDILQKITRLGIRYISEFPNMKIFENLNINSSLPSLEKEISSTTLRSEINGENYTGIVNLANNIKVPRNHHNKVVDHVSLMDIDVFNSDMELEDIESVKENLNYLHKKEKEIFFGLLNEKFLASLNPEY